ncbi:MAG: hypothetical protein F6J90_04030 [Moorea sp. SIOASIH]|nr:hypothetical protein [Moorena sp. SIOASIH]
MIIFDAIFPTPYSLFPVPCSLFPVPCSLKPRTFYLNQLYKILHPSTVLDKSVGTTTHSNSAL